MIQLCLENIEYFIRRVWGKMGVVVFIILMIIGLVNVLSPQTAWYLRDGWRYKDAEPSDFALSMNRIVGVLILVIGIIVMIFNFGSCLSSSSGVNSLKTQFDEENVKSISITYNLNVDKELNEEQIERFASIIKSENIQKASREDNGGSVSGSYILDAKIYFKDGSTADFSTLNNNFDISYEGKNYKLNSSTLASFLAGIGEEK